MKMFVLYLYQSKARKNPGNTVVSKNEEAGCCCKMNKAMLKHFLFVEVIRGH